jgi:uncharacterized protein (DUF58 family)
LTLLVGSAAVNAANNMLYLITAGLLALMALSGIIAYWALQRLELHIALPRDWFAGEEVPLRMTVVNNRRRLPSFLLCLRNAEDDFLLTEVPAGTGAHGVLRYTFQRRGTHDLGEITVTSAFPFAFFHRGGTLPLQASVLVYPRPLFRERQDSAPQVGREVGAGASTKGVGGDFHGLRDYCPGDQPSRVNWKAWARTGRLVVNEFDEESAPPLLLTLESVPGPTLEERLGQLTGLVLEAHRLGRPVGLSLPGEVLEPGCGAAQRERQLRALALFPG